MNNHHSATCNAHFNREKSAKTLTYFRSSRQMEIKTNVVNSKVNEILSAVNAAKRTGIKSAIKFKGSELICKIGNIEKSVFINSYHSIPRLTALLSLIYASTPAKAAIYDA